MTELRELFDRTVERLRAIEDPKEMNKILFEFKNELSEGEIKEFFFGLEKIAVPSFFDESFEELGPVIRDIDLDQYQEQIKTELGKALQEIPVEIIKACEKKYNFFILRLQTMYDIKRIVTHDFPHADEICAIWLLRRFCHGLEYAEIKFIPLNERGGETLYGEPVDFSPNIFYIGVCHSRFDEHQEKFSSDSSTSLVWKFLDNKKLFPQGPAENAIKEIVSYISRGDKVDFERTEFFQFQASTIIHNYCLNGSAEGIKFGLKMLDILFDQLVWQNQYKEEWSSRIEFDTKWGPGVAIESQLPRFVLWPLAKNSGFKILVFVVRDSGYRGFNSDVTTDVDLTEVYQSIKEIEPEASWFLHPQKKMLLCGGRDRSNVNPSRLSLEELVGLIKV